MKLWSPRGALHACGRGVMEVWSAGGAMNACRCEGKDLWSFRVRAVGAWLCRYAAVVQTWNHGGMELLRCAASVWMLEASMYRALDGRCECGDGEVYRSMDVWRIDESDLKARRSGRRAVGVTTRDGTLEARGALQECKTSRYLDER